MACACMAVNCRTGQASLWVHNPRAQSAGKSSFWRVGEGRVLGCEKKKPCAQASPCCARTAPRPTRRHGRPQNLRMTSSTSPCPTRPPRPRPPPAPPPRRASTSGCAPPSPGRPRTGRAGCRREAFPASRMHRLVKTLLMSVLVCAMHRSVGEHRLGIRGDVELCNVSEAAANYCVPRALGAGACGTAGCSRRCQQAAQGVTISHQQPGQSAAVKQQHRTFCPMQHQQQCARLPPCQSDSSLQSDDPTEPCLAGQECSIDTGLQIPAHGLSIGWMQLCS